MGQLFTKFKVDVLHPTSLIKDAALQFQLTYRPFA